MLGGRTATDDGDPNWLDDDEIEEEEEECLWRHDEEAVGDALPPLTRKEHVLVEAELKYRRQGEANARGESIVLRHWRLYWARVYRSAQEKLARSPPPGRPIRKLLTADERRVWRVCAAWNEPDAGPAELESLAWHDLPGEPKDWPESFDYARHGLALPSDWSCDQEG